MRRIDALLAESVFKTQLESQVSSAAFNRPAKIADDHDGGIQGTVSCVHSIQFKFSDVENFGGAETDYCVRFLATGTAVVNFQNSEGESGTQEPETLIAGTADIVLDPSAFVGKFDAAMAAKEAWITVELERMSFPDQEPTTAAFVKPDGGLKPKRKRAKKLRSQSGEVDLELIPEGEMQVQEFAGKQIRKILHNDEWFFSLVDVIQAVAETDRPSKYWNDLKTRIVTTEGYAELVGRITQLKMMGADGRRYDTDCGNTETVFRVIQSINTPKAGHFKQWLAKVGYERIQERQNPSIAIKRAVVDYQLQGRSMQWIDARLRTILSRKQLTDEWSKRGVKEGNEFARLTDVISKETFGKTTGEHRVYKELQKNMNLRDNMSEIELILTMLGETSTKQIADSRNAIGLRANEAAAKSGGAIAGNARSQLEKQLGRSVVSKENNLQKLPPSNAILDFPKSHEKTIEAIVDAGKQSRRKSEDAE